jgi:hypothetical protein
VRLEGVFFDAVTIIAAGGAVIKFALYEWESVLLTWRRVTAVHKSRESIRPQSEG